MKYKYYTAQMACRDNVTRTITITTDATDNDQTKALTITACNISMDSDEDVFTPLRPLRGKLGIYCNDDDISIEDLLPINKTAHTILITTNNIIEFYGYLTSDSSTQAYPPQGEEFELQFVSRLGIADKVEFSPLDTLAPNVLCPVAGLLSYCFTLLGFKSPSEMFLPVVWDNSGTNIYANAKISLSALCDYTETEGKYIYTTPDKQAGKYSDVTVADVLTTIADTFLFTITEKGNDIYGLTPFIHSEYMRCAITDILPNAQPATIFPAHILQASPISDIFVDSSVSYHNGSHKVAVEMTMDADEHPWNPDRYRYNWTGTVAIPGIDGICPKYGQAALGNLMTVNGDAVIVDALTPVNMEKSVYISNNNPASAAPKQYTLKFQPTCYLYDEIYRRLTLNFMCKHYVRKTEEQVVTWKWEDYPMNIISWKLRGINITPTVTDDGYVIDVAHIDHLDASHTPKPPFIGELEITISVQTGDYLFSMGDCTSVCMTDSLYPKLKNDDIDSITYRHFTDLGGEDYEKQLSLCELRNTPAFQFNCIFYGNRPYTTLFGSMLREKIKSQKCNNWQTISLSQRFKGIPFVMKDAADKFYLLTGYSRDYMNSKDSIQITSISL